jgi:uncharacterized membrane protein
MAGSKQARRPQTPAGKTSPNKNATSRTPASRTSADRTSASRTPAGKRPGSPTAPATPAAAVPAAGGYSDPPWLRWTVLVLSVAGFGVSVYLTIAHYTSSAILACSDSGLVNCGKVTTSPESNVFGIFPVAVLGLAFFVFMLAINSPWAWRSRQPLIPVARLASVLVGIVFVLYLVYTELFTLNAICLYCTAVHIITFLLFALIMYSTATRTAPSARPRS